MVIDSKVSLSAFHAYVKAETDEDHNMELSLHLSLTGKNIPEKLLDVSEAEAITIEATVDTQT